jgi:hypothetical protein
MDPGVKPRGATVTKAFSLSAMTWMDSVSHHHAWAWYGVFGRMSVPLAAAE